MLFFYKYIFLQMPSYANTSINRSYSIGFEDVDVYFSLGIALLLYGYMLSLLGLVLIYSKAKIQTKSEGNKKPKAYFQFWAFHIFFIAFLLYTVMDNFTHNENREINHKLGVFTLAWGTFMPVVIVANIGIGWFDLETPTYCFCCCCMRCSHCLVLLISLITFSLFISFSIITIPTLVFIYYLYPARTLARLPLIVSAVLYINTLLGHLIYQCEAFSYVCCRWKCLKECVHSVKSGPTKHYDDQIQHGCINSFLFKALLKLYTPKQLPLLPPEPPPPFKQRAQNHDAYYESETTIKSETGSEVNRGCVAYCSYCVLPIATLLTIYVLVTLLVMTTQLTTLNRNTEDENFKQLLTLVPTLTLFYGFWANRETFCGTRTKKKKKRNREGYEELDQPEKDEQ